MSQISLSRFLLFIALLMSMDGFGQRHSSEPFDVLHYQFDVILNDSTDLVAIDAELTIIYAKKIPEFTIIDLASEAENGFGMKVSLLKFNDSIVDFSHQSDQLKIATPTNIHRGDTALIRVSYAGRADNGLVIAKNANGDRTFFAEHWPNRAHRWLPVIDHPSEKATCQFEVTAPSKYSVVSNGVKKSERMLAGGMKETIWKMTKPIPTKVMVIGVAEFVTTTLDDDGLITVWTYDKPASRAFDDFSDTPEIFTMMTDYVGDYPYAKCDQVESTTRFGGMENAGNIFYPERLLNGTHAINEIIAHEIAHQWFGNAVTEADWEDVWISEGFATFLTYYFVSKHEGEEALLSKLASDEEKILNYQYRFPSQTVVQKNISSLEDVLNPMTYQKAGWVLRMLDAKVGQNTFGQIMNGFYERYKYSNASTQDFVDLANEMTTEDLTPFFNQWFYVPGAPSVDYHWKYKKGQLTITFAQQTVYTYQFDLDIHIRHAGGETQIKRIALSKKRQEVTLVCKKPGDVIIDPSNIILGEFFKK